MLCRKKVPPGSESVHLLYKEGRNFPSYPQNTKTIMEFRLKDILIKILFLFNKREFKSPRSFAEFDNLFSDKNESLSIYLRDVIKELFIIHIQEINDLI